MFARSLTQQAKVERLRMTGSLSDYYDAIEKLDTLQATCRELDEDIFLMVQSFRTERKTK